MRICVKGNVGLVVGRDVLIADQMRKSGLPELICSVGRSISYGVVTGVCIPESRRIWRLEYRNILMEKVRHIQEVICL